MGTPYHILCFSKLVWYIVVESIQEYLVMTCDRQCFFQLSVLVYSDLMIIVCHMFNGSFMWHILPCCTLAIIDTAWEVSKVSLFKHTLKWRKPLYAVGIYRKEIVAYWKSFVRQAIIIETTLDMIIKYPLNVARRHQLARYNCQNVWNVTYSSRCYSWDLWPRFNH